MFPFDLLNALSRDDLADGGKKRREPRKMDSRRSQSSWLRPQATPDELATV
jgi:hypothetical protein